MPLYIIQSTFNINNAFFLCLYAGHLILVVIILICNKSILFILPPTWLSRITLLIQHHYLTITYLLCPLPKTPTATLHLSFTHFRVLFLTISNISLFLSCQQLICAQLLAVLPQAWSIPPH